MVGMDGHCSEPSANTASIPTKILKKDSCGTMHVVVLLLTFAIEIPMMRGRNRRLLKLDANVP